MQINSVSINSKPITNKNLQKINPKSQNFSAIKLSDNLEKTMQNLMVVNQDGSNLKMAKFVAKCHNVLNNLIKKHSNPKQADVVIENFTYNDIAKGILLEVSLPHSKEGGHIPSNFSHPPRTEELAPLFQKWQEEATEQYNFSLPQNVIHRILDTKGVNEFFRTDEKIDLNI